MWICFRILSLKTKDTCASSWLFDFVSKRQFLSESTEQNRMWKTQSGRKTIFTLSFPFMKKYDSKNEIALWALIKRQSDPPLTACHVGSCCERDALSPVFDSRTLILFVILLGMEIPNARLLEPADKAACSITHCNVSVARAELCTREIME